MGDGGKAAGMKPAVFLDRDGVLSRSLVRDGRPYAPTSLAEFDILPEAAAALARLKHAGFLLIVATNQPDVGRGTVPRFVVEAMHDRLRNILPLDDICVCYQPETPDNRYYKPAPGMLLDAAERHGIDLARSYMIGDRWRDVDCGRNAGCFTVFVDRHYTEKLRGAPDATCADVAVATEIVLDHFHRNPAPKGRDAMTDVTKLNVKIFADGADLAGIRAMTRQPWIKGFTTNPTLMRKSGVTDYRAFAREALAIVGDLPISFEVFADDFAEMERQALEIGSWGPNVYVKIPITNTQRQSAGPLIHKLSRRGIALNVTAIMTLDQVEETAGQLDPDTPAIVSVFAGRIADTGIDPVPMMRQASTLLAARPRAELLWASPREVLNIVQAAEIGCPIITVTNDLLAKTQLFGKDLEDYSLETVKMFYNDAAAAGFSIPLPEYVS
jgi:transaldolase